MYLQKDTSKKPQNKTICSVKLTSSDIFHTSIYQLLTFSHTHTQIHTKIPFLLFHTQIATSKCSTEKPETFFCKVPLSRLSGPQAAELKASRVKNTLQHPLTLACICLTAASTENSIQIFIYILESHTISRPHSQLENCFSAENW